MNKALLLFTCLATLSIISTIPLYGAMKNNAQPCLTCQKPFDKDNQPVSSTQLFHPNCMGSWFTKHKACRFCQSTLNEDFLCAVRTDNISYVKSLLAAGANVNIQDDYYQTPLHIAATKGYKEIVTVYRANVDSQDLMGVTPLHDAAYQGYTEIITLFIGAGANVNIRNLWGETPLHFAVLAHRMESIKYLLDRGADVNAQDIVGITPLALAHAMQNIPKIN